MRSVGHALSVVAVLGLFATAAAVPPHALAGTSSDTYHLLTVPRVIAMCQTIYRDERLNVRIVGRYVPVARRGSERKHRAGWLYAASRPTSAASGTGQPRVWVIWAQRHSAAITRGVDVMVRGVLNTRTCVLRARTVSSTTLQDVPPRHRSTLSLTIIQPLGHRPAFRSVGLLFSHGMTIKYSYLCHNARGRMTITVMPSTVAYRRHIPRRDVLATFRTAVARRGIGTYTYGKKGWFRIGVATAGQCSWSMRLYAGTASSAKRD